jgi:hypothetical protein
MRGYSRSMLVYIRLRRKKGNSWLEKFSEKVQFRNSISFELVPELGKIYRIYINADKLLNVMGPLHQIAVRNM